MNKLIVAVLACFIMAFAATGADARIVVGIGVDDGYYRHHHRYYQPYYYQPNYYQRCYVDFDDEVICQTYRHHRNRVIYYY
jgi:hypothetical protein